MPKITLLLAITAGVLAVLLSPFAGGASLGLFITMITLARLARARKDLELARLDLQVARDQHRHEMKIWQARYRNQAMDLADLRKKIWRENNGRTPLRRVSDRKPEEDGA